MRYAARTLCHYEMPYCCRLLDASLMRDAMRERVYGRYTRMPARHATLHTMLI